MAPAQAQAKRKAGEIQSPPDKRSRTERTEACIDNNAMGDEAPEYFREFLKEFRAEARFNRDVGTKNANDIENIKQHCCLKDKLGLLVLGIPNDFAGLSGMDGQTGTQPFGGGTPNERFCCRVSHCKSA